jgi:GNAT superfamily N-acetyltransferase
LTVITPLPLVVRRGESTDIPAVSALYDEAVAWLVELGNSGQWGTEPLSADPRRAASFRTWVSDRMLWVAESEGAVVGAIALGPHHSYVDPVPEPELYVVSFVTARSLKGRGIGEALLDLARSRAREQGAALLRVDCWAGGDGALVRYYERAGFVRTQPFIFPHRRGPWHGQILEQRI